jgi:MraZ protein
MAVRGAQGAAEGTGVETSARANVFGHDALSGTYRTRLDPNGRVVLPSALRAPFLASGVGHLMPRRAECLWLLTPQGFEEMVDAVVRQSEGMLDAETRALLFKAAPKVSVDKQSRLVVPPEQREHVEFQPEAEVVLAGAIERVEIWPARRWDTEQAPKLADLDLLLDGHSGLPTGTA